MQLTKGLEQAACIMALLATQEQNVPISSHVIHDRLSGSQTYLRKIMRKLVVSGLVKSVSGNNGGFSLAVDPKGITLLQVVQATEGDVSTFPNLGFINKVFQDFEPIASKAEVVLNTAFAQADQRWAQYLDDVTVAQLLWEVFEVKDFPRVNWNDPNLKIDQYLLAKFKGITFEIDQNENK